MVIWHPLDFSPSTCTLLTLDLFTSRHIIRGFCYIRFVVLVISRLSVVLFSGRNGCHRVIDILYEYANLVLSFKFANFISKELLRCCLEHKVIAEKKPPAARGVTIWSH